MSLLLFLIKYLHLKRKWGWEDSDFSTISATHTVTHNHVISLSLTHTHLPPTYFIFFLPLLITPFPPPKDSSVDRGFYLESQHFRIPSNIWISPTFIQALTQEPSFFSLKDNSVLLTTEQATSLYIIQGGTPLSQSSHCGWCVFMRSIYWSYEKMIWH